jgi:hypothetical protein
MMECHREGMSEIPCIESEAYQNALMSGGSLPEGFPKREVMVPMRRTAYPNLRIHAPRTRT